MSERSSFFPGPVVAVNLPMLLVAVARPPVPVERSPPDPHLTSPLTACRSATHATSQESRPDDCHGLCQVELRVGACARRNWRRLSLRPALGQFQLLPYEHGILLAGCPSEQSSACTASGSHPPRRGGKQSIRDGSDIDRGRNCQPARTSLRAEPNRFRHPLSATHAPLGCTLGLADVLAVGLAQNPDLLTIRGTADVSAAAAEVAGVYPWNPFVQAQYFPQGHPFSSASSPGGLAGSSNYYVWAMQCFELGHQRRYREQNARPCARAGSLEHSPGGAAEHRPD